MHSAYVFEAKSVQAYILAGGKLRDIAGGSALIDWLTSPEENEDDTPLSRLKDECQVASVPRAAGGALTVLFKNDQDGHLAKVFRAIWCLTIAKSAPGLVFADGIGIASNSAQALEEAQSQSRAAANVRTAELPQAQPIMVQSQRMAAPAVYIAGQTGKDGFCKITKERTDKATLAKRAFQSGHRDRLGALLAGNDKPYFWPNEFDPEEHPAGSIVFPFDNTEEREIAIVHADGDAIGTKIIATINEAKDPGAEIENISAKLSQATRAAAKIAVREVLLPKAQEKKGRFIVPARPILLGGDDLTMIVRADLALDFLDTYVQAFAAKTKEAFAEENEGHAFRKGLTASGAAVCIKARQPFSKALQLTEALTKHAKSQGAGRISFFRTTTSKIPASVEEAWPHKGLSLQTYSSDEYEKLKALADVISEEAIGRSGLHLVLETEPSLSKSAFERACQIMDKRKVPGKDDPSHRLTSALSDLAADIEQSSDRLNAGLRDAFLLMRLEGSNAD